VNTVDQLYAPPSRLSSGTGRAIISSKAMRWSSSGNRTSSTTTTTTLSSLVLLLLLSSLSIISVNAQVVPNTGIVIPLIYNNDYNPDALDLITQGILKYGIFKDVNKYPALKLRLTSVLGGLNLNLNVANLIKLDLGLGVNRRHAKKRRAATSTDDDAGKHTSEHDKRLLGLKLGLGSLLGVDLGILGGASSSSSSSHSSAPTSSTSSSTSPLLDVQLGVQLIIDPGWNGATTTRLMNSQADNAVSLCRHASSSIEYNDADIPFFRSPHSLIEICLANSGSPISHSELPLKPSLCSSIPVQQILQYSIQAALPALCQRTKHSIMPVVRVTPPPPPHSTLNTAMVRA
jgi:hypothetical protein